METLRHIRAHQIKLSPKWADWGYLTLCGQKVSYARTTHSEHLTCKKCLRSYMMKKENELQEMKNFI